MLQLTILNAQGAIRQGKNDYDDAPKDLHNTGSDSVFLATQALTYANGDIIRLQVDRVPGYYVVQFDETLAPTLIYLTTPTWDYPIDLSQNAQDARPEAAFKTQRHYLSARRAWPEETDTYRDWALNPHDQPQATVSSPMPTLTWKPATTRLSLLKTPLTASGPAISTANTPTCPGASTRIPTLL